MQGGSPDNEDGVSEDSAIDTAHTQGHYVGKYKFDKNDVQQFKEWGIDYLKMDWVSSVDKPDDAPAKMPFVQLIPTCWQLAGSDSEIESCTIHGSLRMNNTRT